MRLLPYRIGAITLALICFLLPFVRVSCNKQPMMEITGLELAVGQEIRALDFTRSLSDSLMSDWQGGKPEDKTKKNDEIDLQWQVTVSAGLLVLALLLVVFLRTRRSALIGAICCLLALAALGAFYFDTEAKGEEKVFGFIVSYRLLAAYWFSLAFMLMAAVLGFLDFAHRKPLPETVSRNEGTAFADGEQ